MRKFGIDSRLGLAFGFPVGLVLFMGLLAIQNIRDISDTTEMLYRHPFAVSRAMLRIDANIVRMHRSMKDAALAEDPAALNETARLVRQLESEVLQDLELVKERFLGDQNDIIGLEELFMEWRPIREEVITLMRAGNRLQAAQITRDKGAQHVDRLSASAAGLLEFASVKADEFFTGAQSGRDVAVNLMVLILVAAVVVSILFFVLVSRSIPHITADREA